MAKLREWPKKENPQTTQSQPKAASLEEQKTQNEPPTPAPAPPRVDPLMELIHAAKDAAQHLGRPVPALFTHRVAAGVRLLKAAEAIERTL